MPRAVAVPADVDDVIVLLRWARAAGLSLVPRASGSSMPGGAVGSGVDAVPDGTRANQDPTRRRVRRTDRVHAAEIDNDAATDRAARHAAA
jgi:FAD/FMN-containing dehydrogenase